VADEEMGRQDAESRLEPFAALSTYKASMNAKCSKFSAAQAKASVDNCMGLKGVLGKMVSRIDKKL
jgi:hypothetical protein